MRLSLLIFVLIALVQKVKGEDGYRLWLRFDPIEDQTLLEKYRKQCASLYVEGVSATMDVVRKELTNGLSKMLDKEVQIVSVLESNQVIAGIYGPSSVLAEVLSPNEVQDLSEEGYVILSKNFQGKNVLVIAANHDIGVLYGTYHFLRLMQTQKDITSINIRSSPKIDIRILNHWDNLDRTVERGYAGFSIWNWHQLPEYQDPRYEDYARANASIGINATVLTNVNANALALSPFYLEKVKVLADIFRPYGIKVYLTARFSAPMELGNLQTADPQDQEVRLWWKKKVSEIYSYVPDFGGFLVKANSEGQPGPQDYHRTHAEGANMLADAIAPYGGIVMWRAFVYKADTKTDRHMQAHNEFEPLDGDFRSNVIIQIKNGAIDFQPREPFHPLFGGLKNTNIMPEFQITQEYLGQGTHLVYLGSLFKEVLEADTKTKGDGSTVAKIIDGSITRQQLTAMAGVANMGTDRNWTGHPFGQANWYAFGRLAWNHELSAEEIADEWIRLTFGTDSNLVRNIHSIMMSSYQTLVDYMTPLGLHHIMAAGHHYGPGPWVDKMRRSDWTSTYYHRADSLGIGFDRSKNGSGAVLQYERQIAKIFGHIETCPEQYLLWFHHLSWSHRMPSGNILWDELSLRYQRGVEQTRDIAMTWNSLEGKIDETRFRHVQQLLMIQTKEAAWWRDACLSYFQSFSGMPLPEGVPAAGHHLDHYQSLQFKYAPGH